MVYNSTWTASPAPAVSLSMRAAVTPRITTASGRVISWLSRRKSRKGISWRNPVSHITKIFLGARVTLICRFSIPLYSFRVALAYAYAVPIIKAQIILSLAIPHHRFFTYINRSRNFDKQAYRQPVLTHVGRPWAKERSKHSLLFVLCRSGHLNVHELKA